MDRNKIKKEILKIIPECDPKTAEDFFERMDPDYFSFYPGKEVASHLRMMDSLDPDHPVRVKFFPRGKKRYEIVIVAYDYFSEFSILCGWLATSGFDIQAGNIYTLTGKILDIFEIRLRPGEVFNASVQANWVSELNALIRLLGNNRFQEARDRVNRRLIQHLEKMKVRLSGTLFPVEIRFDNRISKNWTVMDVRSKNTPAFLYAFSNALAMRGIYIHRVQIESIGAEARDRFFISDRSGHKIEGDEDQKSLRMGVALIKQFTHFLTGAPDPAQAIRHFDQLLDRIMEQKPSGSAVSFFRGKEGLDFLAQLLGTSNFLWEDFLRMQHEHLLPILEEVTRKNIKPARDSIKQELSRAVSKCGSFEEKKKIVNEFKDRMMFQIDMRHLLASEGNLMDFSGELTDLTEVVLDQTLAIVQQRLAETYGRPIKENGAECPFTILGLGKFGGREMGYASDIELLFAHGGSGHTQGVGSIENDEYFGELARDLTDFIEARQEGIFQIDLRLRPNGESGPLSNPIDRLKSYYRPEGEAAPFERQALIKLRWVAGDEALGRAVEECRNRFVYSGRPWDLREALHLRARQRRELVKPGKTNVKYSRGGIIDIEYAVQYLQIMNGKGRPELRTPFTLKALQALHRQKILSQKEYNLLRESYLFLRTLIDGLRMARGNARDLLLPEAGSNEFKFLARRLGYRHPDWDKGAKQLEDQIRRHMDQIGRFFEKRFEKKVTV